MIAVCIGLCYAVVIGAFGWWGAGAVALHILVMLAALPRR